MGTLLTRFHAATERMSSRRWLISPKTFWTSFEPENCAATTL